MLTEENVETVGGVNPTSETETPLGEQLDGGNDEALDEGVEPEDDEDEEVFEDEEEVFEEEVFEEEVFEDEEPEDEAGPAASHELGGEA
jgi:hypothetical protein